jgi:CubicO group peptidase (beta-lactamase class C family)
MPTPRFRRLTHAIAILSLILTMPGTSPAQLERGTSASVGMSEEQLEVAASILADQVKSGPISAAAIAVARRNKIVLARGFGKLARDAGSPDVDANSIFLLASITKPVTACALMILVDRGLISLDDPVSQYIPEFQGGERAQVTVRNLLSHISGLPDMLPQNTDLRRANAPLSEFVAGAATTPLLYSPGKSFRYQSKGILLAAEIV